MSVDRRSVAGRDDDEPYIRDGDVVGMGAENPKGYAACVVAAAQAIKAAAVPLQGSLLVGLGAGGMPTNRRPSSQKFNAGQGAGCAFMLEQGVRGDFAIIAKPGWSVAWEEVGLCWFKVIVRGDLNYTGVRHVVKGRNPIVHAAKVIGLLEEWFAEYTEKNTSGLVAPQGSINAIQAGWTHKPAFVPAACHFFVDLRISPRVSPVEAKRQFGEAIERIVKANPEPIGGVGNDSRASPAVLPIPITGLSNHACGRGNWSKAKNMRPGPKPAAPPTPIFCVPRVSPPHVSACPV